MIFHKNKLNFLNNIEKNINIKLFNVNGYVSEIIDLMKENLLNKKGFLKVYLEGGSYLGKSTIVKLIAESFHKTNFINIDLKDYKNSYDINKLIGTQQGYVGYNDTHIFSKLKNNNFAIILFDNYNYAHSNIKDLVKSILKEGYITDNKGEKIYFNNTFIFITDDIENANKVGFNNYNDNNKTHELHNLVDKTIKFKNLTKDVLEKYLESKKIKDKDKIIKSSEYEKYNYKNIEKLIKENLLINN